MFLIVLRFCFVDLYLRILFTIRITENYVLLAKLYVVYTGTPILFATDFPFIKLS